MNTGHSGDKVPYDVGIGILIVVCVFVSGFAYSWGPLAWLVRAPPSSSFACTHSYRMRSCWGWLVRRIARKLWCCKGHHQDL
jgi:hypothetical protein